MSNIKPDGLGALVRYLVRGRGARAAWLTVLSVVNAATQGMAIALLVPLLGVAGVPPAQGVMEGIDRAVSAVFRAVGLAPSLVAVLALFVLLAWIQAFLQQLELVGTARWEQDFIRALREDLYAALVLATWRFFTQRRATDLTHAVTRDADRAGAAAGYLMHAAAESVAVAMYAVLAFVIAPSATLIVLGGALLLALMLRPTVRSAHTTGEELGNASADALAFVTEHVDAIKLVKSFGAEWRARDAFEGLATRSADAMVGATRSHARAHVATAAGSATLLGIVLWVAIQKLHLDPATILVLLYVFWRLVPRLMDVQQSLRLAVHEAPGFAVVQQLMAQAVAAQEAPAGGPPVATPPGAVVALAFDAVTFAYDTVHVLRECSLDIVAGHITGIAGPSGAGKTTVVDLVLGLLTPTAGEVRVDGRSLEPGALAAWRARVGYVPQESFLFHDTILANLAWARPGASVGDVWAALGAAAADDFVRALPDGLDTVVGDRGVRLSGGERQRLALARALLRKPALLVLDEATSAVDAASEGRILNALAALRGSLTILVVSHRQAPLALADTIYFLADGRARRQASGAV